MEIYFRMYSSILNDFKVQALDFEDRWPWVCLLAIASENNGRIEKDVSYIAIKSRLSEDIVKKSISNMLKLKLLDETDDYYSPHNWSRRQFPTDNPTLWKRQWRARKKQTANNESEPRTKDENSMKNNAEDNEKTASENRPITPPSFPPSFPPLNPPILTPLLTPLNNNNKLLLLNNNSENQNFENHKNVKLDPPQKNTTPKSIAELVDEHGVTSILEEEENDERQWMRMSVTMTLRQAGYSEREIEHALNTLEFTIRKKQNIDPTFKMSNPLNYCRRIIDNERIKRQQAEDEEAAKIARMKQAEEEKQAAIEKEKAEQKAKEEEEKKYRKLHNVSYYPDGSIRTFEDKWYSPTGKLIDFDKPETVPLRQELVDRWRKQYEKWRQYLQSIADNDETRDSNS